MLSRILLCLLLLVVVSFLSSSCGFRAIYANNKFSPLEEKRYQQELASISIKKVRKHLDQQLKNHLEDALNPHGIKIEPKYLLAIDLTRNISSTFTTFTGSSGRNRISLVATYTLKELNSGKIISSGTAQASDDFNVDEKLFANYFNDETVGLNLTKIISDNMVSSIINDVVLATENKSQN